MAWRGIRVIFQYSEWEAPQDKRIVADCHKGLALYGIRNPLLPWDQFHQFLTETTMASD
jgi:hypothetical protein